MPFTVNRGTPAHAHATAPQGFDAAPQASFDTRPDAPRPSFAAPAAYNQHTGRMPAPRSLMLEAVTPRSDTLLVRSLMQVLDTGTPDDIRSALQQIENGKYGIFRYATRSLVFGRIGLRDDELMDSCLTTAYEMFQDPKRRIYNSPQDLMTAALNDWDYGLARAAVTLDPGAVSGAQFATLCIVAPDIAARVLANKPTLVRSMSQAAFRNVLFEPIHALGEAPRHDVAERNRQLDALMRRYPDWADEIAMWTPDSALVPTALEIGTLPHTPVFWRHALASARPAVVHALALRPESADASLLHKLVVAQDRDLLDTVCRLRPDLVNQPTSSGNSAAHYAAALQDGRTLALLVSHGADVDLPNRRGQTVDAVRIHAQAQGPSSTYAWPDFAPATF